MNKQNFTTFHGLKCLVGNKVDETHYSLIPWEGTTEQLNHDPSFTEYHEWRALAIQVTCSCGHVFYFDDTKMPSGTIYNCACPMCGNKITIEKP